MCTLKANEHRLCFAKISQLFVKTSISAVDEYYCDQNFTPTMKISFMINSYKSYCSECTKL